MTKKHQNNNNDLYLAMSNMDAKFIHFQKESDVKFTQFHQESEKILYYLKNLVSSILIGATRDPENL